MAVAVAEHRSANVSNPHSGMSFSFKKKSKWEGRSGWKRPFAPVFSSGCWWNQGNGWTVVHFWSSVSVGGLNSPSCVCCKCRIIYHKDAHLKVLQLKPISPLEQNHGNRGACGGGWVSFPMWMSAKGAELESRLVLRMAVDGRNVSVISRGQVSPYQTHVCAADQEHILQPSDADLKSLCRCICAHQVSLSHAGAWCSPSGTLNFLTQFHTLH